ncbi:MAG TPA: hypothetical protein VI461_03795 [Chitinophagaceae bacterium]|nr:hypothetical protein [Chitinophagaceae bacterium]
MSKIFYLAIVSISLFVACQDKSKRNLQPELAGCDSATVMYYYTPGNPRFFTMAKVYDKKLISAIGKDVNSKVINAKDDCITQGKIYFYGEGGAVYVVYFSRAKECMTLSFIKTGEKYFTQMSTGVKKLLDRWQKTAREPQTIH